MSNTYDYVAYDSTAQYQQSQFKLLFLQLEALVLTLAPGRPRSLVATKLEEAYHWVGKSVRDDQVARENEAVLQER